MLLLIKLMQQTFAKNNKKCFETCVKTTFCWSLSTCKCMSTFFSLNIYSLAFLKLFRTLKHRKTVSSVVVISILTILAYNFDGAHQEVQTT